MDVGFTTNASGASTKAAISGLQPVTSENEAEAPAVAAALSENLVMPSWPTHAGAFAASHTPPRFTGGDGCALPRISLHVAARNGDAKTIRHMLATGSGDFGMIDPVTGYSALMLAARHGHADIVSLLCDYASDIDLHRQDAQGDTALMLAAAGGHGAVVSLLIDAGANPALRNHAGQSVADLLMAQGSVLASATLASMIISAAGAAFSTVLARPDRSTAASGTTTGTTAATTTATTAEPTNINDDALLPSAENEGLHSESTATRKSRTMTSSDRDCTRQKIAVRVDREARVTAQRNGANQPASTGSGSPALFAALPLSTAVFKTVERHDAQALEALLMETRKPGKNSKKELQRLGNPDVPDDSAIKNRKVTPLMLAAYLGHADLLDLLMDAGAEIDYPDSQGKTALMWAIRGNRLAAAQALLDVGARLDQVDLTGCSALFYAVRHGGVAVVQALLRKGARLSHADAQGRTALMCAAIFGPATSAQALLQGGANPGQSDSAGKCALMYAAQCGHTTIVQSLLHYGAQIDQVDGHGNSALMYAARQGHSATVQTLLNYGAWIDRANVNGVTALIDAVKNGQVAIVDLLMQNGADTTLETRERGDTAGTIASRMGNIECARLLRDPKADQKAGSKRQNSLG